MKAIDILIKHNACIEAKAWAKDQTVEEAWANCPRGDWMLWIYAKLYPNNLKEITLARGHCADTVRHLMKDQRSIDAVDAAIAFGEGRINREELNKAADAAYTASADANAYYAAAYYATAAAAAYYVADAAAYYAAAADAYYAADAATADADTDAAADAAADAARAQNQQQTADICRKYLTLGDLI